MKELVGKKIISIQIDKDLQHFIRFITDTSPIIYEAEGQCCSESWFFHILGVDALLGHTVIRSEEVDMDSINDGKTRQKYKVLPPPAAWDKLYKITLHTKTGYADIEFRNSSNGYYGGSLHLSPKIPDGVNMIDVTEDYTAV